MAHVRQLLNHFTRGVITVPEHERHVGAEVETFFVNADGSAISVEQSQAIMAEMVVSGWRISQKRGEMVTELRRKDDRLQYELGYPNIELSIGPCRKDVLIAVTRATLSSVYKAAEKCGARPSFEPIYGLQRNYLALPDDRDAAWLKLDGKDALTPLARISAVQFTLDVTPASAVDTLNRLNSARGQFLSDYPQDVIWRRYIAESKAGYRADRYGGPDRFDSIEDYCKKLAQHNVVVGTKLVPFVSLETSTLDVDLFLRSIWWYFRLRRYGRVLCAEVRPIPRRSDEELDRQLDMVLSIVK